MIDLLHPTRHTLYQTWYGMHSRCRKPSHVGFKHYGARGIRVCERWYSFAAFVSDVGNRPSERHSLDRVDNDGDYKPENVRWATSEEQAANTRRSRADRTDTVLGARLRAALLKAEMSQSQLADILGMSAPMISRWISGDRSQPPMHACLAIERMFGIPFHEWLTDKEYVSAYGHARMSLLSSA